MNPATRRYVSAPNGRQYSGRWPQAMPSTGEGPYIAALARMIDGACEVVLPCGRADVATNTDIYEVEPARSWRTGVRQAFAYAGQTGLSPGLALFGEADYLKLYLFLRDLLPEITLWVWDGGGGWERITSRRTASVVRRYPDGATRGGAAW